MSDPTPYIDVLQIIDAAGEVELETSPGKPRLLVRDASPDCTVATLRDVLATADGLYDRGTPVRLHHSALQNAMKVQVLRADDLVLFAHQICRPYSISTRGEETREVDVRLPRPFAEMYLGWQGEWQLPVLNGIACSPILRDDGAFHAVEGYDPASGFWCERVPDLRGLVSERPSADDAVKALQHIRQTFRTFCFADATIDVEPGLGFNTVNTRVPPGADESAFLAALLTAVCRASLPLAPGIMIRAAALSGAGAGKGLLARCIAAIAFGEQPAAVSGGSSREELEKRIAAELMEAGPMLFLDNLNNRIFKSDLLASVITERPARVRILGRSQMVPLNSSALVVLTGNGLALSEDLARRFMVIEFDPRTEDPEARCFLTDVGAMCRDQRPALLASVLTIWRWGRQARDLPPGHPFGSFETWCRWVRDPLLALGSKDPVAKVTETKARDIERAEVAEIFDTWWKCHQKNAVAAKDLDDEVRHNMDPLGRGRQWVAAKLEKLTGTRIGGRVLVRQAPVGRHGVAVYSLQSTAEAEQHQGHRGHPLAGTPSPIIVGSDAPDDPDAISPREAAGWRARV